MLFILWGVSEEVTQVFRISPVFLVKKNILEACRELSGRENSSWRAGKRGLCSLSRGWPGYISENMTLV